MIFPTAVFTGTHLFLNFSICIKKNRKGGDDLSGSCFALHQNIAANVIAVQQ
jgi:hypothetical protein